MALNIEKESVEIMRRCSRFDRCSVPICPLDLLQDHRTRLSGEPKCTMPKSIRHRIGRETDLPRKGLTKSEWAGEKRWHAQSEAEKQRKIAHLSKYLPNYPVFSECQRKISIKVPHSEQTPDKSKEIIL